MGSDRPKHERMSGPPPLSDGTPEPDVDRVKLLRAWELNAETQRLVLRRSAVVGWLTLLATAAQLAAAGYVLYRVDRAERSFTESQALVTGMLSEALTATAEVNRVELKEKADEVAQIDEQLRAADDVPDEPAAPATARYRPGTARKAPAAASERAAPPSGPVIAAQREKLADRVAAQQRVEQVIERLAESAPAAAQ